MFAKRIGNLNRKRPRNDSCLLYSSQHLHYIENGEPDPDIDDSDEDDDSDDDFVDGEQVPMQTQSGMFCVEIF